MAMNPIPAEGFNTGDTVYRVTRYSGNRDVRVQRLAVLRKTKTRVTTQGVRHDLSDTWFKKPGNDVLSIQGASVWSSTWVDLYPADHPDLPELIRRAGEVQRRDQIKDAAQALLKEVTPEAVAAMRVALDGWTE